MRVPMHLAANGFSAWMPTMVPGRSVSLRPEVVHPFFSCIRSFLSLASLPRFSGHRHELGQPLSGCQTYRSLRLSLREFLLGSTVSEGSWAEVPYVETNTASPF